jgi:hypothetical protein
MKLVAKCGTVATYANHHIFPRDAQVCCDISKSAVEVTLTLPKISSDRPEVIPPITNGLGIQCSPEYDYIPINVCFNHGIPGA